MVIIYLDVQLLAVFWASVNFLESDKNLPYDFFGRLLDFTCWIPCIAKVPAGYTC
jgi:hypothetical protein